MALTERERKLSIGVGVAVVAFGAYYFGYEPYMADRAQVKTQLEAVTVEQANADRLFARQRREEKVWAEMIAGGLKSNPSEADSQLLHALQDWATASKMTNPSLNQAGKTQEGKFQIITVNFAGGGTTAAVANFLWRLETASIPVRVNDVQITPRKEGVDELQLQFSISTLSMVPAEADPAARGPRALTSAAEWGGRP